MDRIGLRTVAALLLACAGCDCSSDFYRAASGRYHLVVPQEGIHSLVLDNSGLTLNNERGEVIVTVPDEDDYDDGCMVFSAPCGAKYTLFYEGMTLYLRIGSGGRSDLGSAASLPAPSIDGAAGVGRIAGRVGMRGFLEGINIP